MSKRIYVNYVLKVIVLEIFISVAVSLVLRWLVNHYNLELKLNFEALLNAFVNLNAGIIIAIFLSIFNSTNKNIEQFREFKNASKQAYILLLYNSAVACVVSLFVTNTNTDNSVILYSHQQSMNILFATISATVTIFNLYLVYKTLTIVFRKIG